MRVSQQLKWGLLIFQCHFWWHLLKAIRFVNSAVSARSSVYENKVLLTKPFQASQSWRQLSVYENKVLVQSLFTKRMDFRISKLNDFKECLAIIGIVCIANVTIIQGRHRWQAPSRPGPCLDFGFQYALIRKKQPVKTIWGRILGLAWLKFAVAPLLLT